MRNFNLKESSLVKTKAFQEIRSILKLYNKPEMTDEEIIEKIIGSSIIEYEDNLQFIKSTGEVEAVGLFDLYNYIDEGKIITANGCVFDSTSPEKEISGKSILEWKKIRDNFKKLMFSEKEGTLNYMKYDRSQKVQKTNINAAWGAELEGSFFLFNPDLGSAITYSGYLTTSTMIIILEGLYGNFQFDNTSFYYYLDEVSKKLNSLSISDKEILKEVLEAPKDLDKALKERYINTFSIEVEDHVLNTLDAYLSDLEEFDKIILFYINNVKAFFNLNIIKEALDQLYDKDFLDPNKPPESIKGGLNEISVILKMISFPFYRYNASQYARQMEREAILVTDTDSFFLYFKPLIETLFEYKNKTSLLDSFEKEDVKYTLNYLNCYIYIISTFIEYILYDYTTRNNMRDSEKSILNMKNEFVFLSIILTAGKKNYVGARVQREGHFVFPPKVSVTGIPFKKKNVPYKTTKVMNALASKILDFKQLFVVLRELRDFKEYIKKSILTSVEYFPLKSLKPYYKAPLTQEVFRGALLWNELYPEEEIKNNDECFMVKLDPDKIDEILKEQDPENQIFQAYINIEKTYQDFSKTNPVLALPLSKLNVPEEFVDLILSESIIDLNLNTFSPILKSFNVHLGGSSKNRPTSILKIQ